MEDLDFFQDIALHRLGKGIVLGDDAAKPVDGFSSQERFEDRPLFLRIPQAKRLDEDIVGRLVLGLDERMEQLIEHSSCSLSDRVGGNLRNFDGESL